MKSIYYPPIYAEKQFHCPQCRVFASQVWNPAQVGSLALVPGVSFSYCTHCKQYSIWVNSSLLYPASTMVELPNEDLPAEIIGDYNEAAAILSKSPRGAAALLRLAIQKLCVVLGEKGKKIDEDIANLVKKGLSVQIQQALDVVRVIGNEAVHPGSMDLRDDAETAARLFGLVNLIADAMITQPKKVKEMYDALPADKLKGIEDRDKSKK